MTPYPDLATLDVAEAKSHFTGRSRFLAACRCLEVDRTPVWLMRQAGRCLPEYRALKERFSFVEMVRTPELAAEVTLQPVERFGFDAAILFSDILVVAEALGQAYRFRDGGGIEMEFPLRNEGDIARLEARGVGERLEYAARALALIKRADGGRRAVLGFAGSPWTLANYMLEGGSAREFTKAKALFYTEPRMFARLMEKLTAAVIEYLRLQIDAGADAVQIFDTSGGLLAASAFEEASARWIREIIAALDGRAPVIVFSKGTHASWDGLVRTGADVIGVDWTMRLAHVRKRLPADVALQGNLDPCLLCSSPHIVAAETTRILREMAGKRGHIFNLGHGVPPQAKLECIAALVETVRDFR
ncbi:MAG TPA: uroporphyrinogen decarboxylase [Chthoniobacteraceae bacterium]|nr:uroporphyrinogen decarboxylase [Chthoniobacteraceae bacterium]